MISKKLATLLTLGVMLGQTGLLSTLLAQADTQLPTQLDPIQKAARAAAKEGVVESPTGKSTLEVASVIQRPDIAPDNDGILKVSPGPQAPVTPDIYTIDLGADKMPDVIQVVKDEQNAEQASLYVNGLEVLRFRSEFIGMSPYARVKAVADKLNSLLVLDREQAVSVKPVLLNKQPVIVLGEDAIVTVDAESARLAKLDAKRLAFLWTNRLRQALGEEQLAAKDYPQFHEQPQTAMQYKGTGKFQAGEASWYGPGFHGRRTASGSRFNQFAMTAAHRRLPFGTLVRVTNQRNKKSCVVKITDRGPYAHGRIIDLSRGAAQAIGMSGVAKVSLEVVSPGG